VHDPSREVDLEARRKIAVELAASREAVYEKKVMGKVAREASPDPGQPLRKVGAVVLAPSLVLGRIARRKVADVVAASRGLVLDVRRLTTPNHQNHLVARHEASPDLGPHALKISVPRKKTMGLSILVWSLAARQRSLWKRNNK